MTTLKTTAWKHQEDAAAFALERRATLLAMGMGTGKSRVVIDLIARRDHRRVLIVCPLTVMSVWPGQFATHIEDPELNLVLLTGGTSAHKGYQLRKALQEATVKGRRLVVVTNYDSYWRSDLAKEILGQLWDLVVLDESHKIKAPGGKASWFAKKLRATHRLCLTGTPMPHSPLDVYGQFRFLDRTIYGSNFTLMRKRYAVMGGYEFHQVVGYQNMEEFQRKLALITFQVGNEVLDLPEKHHVTRTFTLSRGAMNVYRDLEDELVAEVDRGLVTASNALVKLLRLQQITNGYCVTEDGIETALDTGRVDLLQEILDELPPDEPVAIFARFRHDLDAIRNAASSLHRASGELSGRANDLSSWQAGEFPVLAIQIQSGGVGIDLTRARYAIYYSVDFSLGNYEQSLARIYRPGQTRTCIYVHLVAEKTIDQKIYKALSSKKDVVETILAECRNGTRHRNDDESKESAWTLSECESTSSSAQ